MSKKAKVTKKSKTTKKATKSSKKTIAKKKKTSKKKSKTVNSFYDKTMTKAQQKVLQKILDDSLDMFSEQWYRARSFRKTEEDMDFENFFDRNDDMDLELEENLEDCIEIIWPEIEIHYKEDILKHFAANDQGPETYLKNLIRKELEF